MSEASPILHHKDEPLASVAAPLGGRIWGMLTGPPVKEEYVLSRWLFLRGLGLVYFFAFASLTVQILGLVGSRGILPASTFLQSVAGPGEPGGFWLAPTLAWMNSSDSFLHFLCWGGVGLSVLLILGILPGPVLALLWAFYLSLVTVGQDFMGFQWDSLLLETGLLSVFFAPLQLWWGLPREVAPSRIVLWLLRFLLFRLMFFSGLVKLMSGDPTWHGLTALSFHYWTQPLPTPVAWYMNQLPAQFHSFSTAATLIIELGAPWLIFGPRRVRLLGAALLAGLQLSILLTGNFAYFNILSIVLCVPLLDDSIAGKLVPEAVRRRIGMPASRTQLAMLPRRVVTFSLAALVLSLTWVQVQSNYFSYSNIPQPMLDAAFKLAPFDVVNSYGLFAVMTTSRPEIVVEGSNDGTTWQEYEFLYKPSDPGRMPPWVAPHQPRLDWQMWFAALSGPSFNSFGGSWFTNFVRRLLEGSPDVLALLGKNPFPQAPPKYIRAELYNYTFTGFGTPGGGWWHRELTGLFLPPTTLSGLR